MTFKSLRGTAGSTLVVAASALTLAACGSSSPAHPASSSSSSSVSASTAASAPVQHGPTAVAISNFAFAPAAVTVAPGTKVTFTNKDQTQHTATSSSGAFDTGTLNPGASHSIVLTKPGTYTYYCQFHAFMKGTIIVR